MSRAWRALPVLAALSLPQPASALVFCTGTVTESWLNDVGGVLIQGSWHGAHTQICNIRETWKGITPDICAAWTAKMDAAVADERSVVVHYVAESSCAALPPYEASPAPTYVMLN